MSTHYKTAIIMKCNSARHYMEHETAYSICRREHHDDAFTCPSCNDATSIYLIENNIYTDVPLELASQLGFTWLNITDILNHLRAL